MYTRHETWFYFARPVSIQEVLEGIVARTNERQGPDQPQFTTVRPVLPAAGGFPVYVKAPPDGKVGVIYCEGHCACNQGRAPRLVLSFRPIPGFGRRDDTVFTGGVKISLSRATCYPLSVEEVQWSIAHDCGSQDHEWLAIPECWENLNDFSEDDMAKEKAECARKLAELALANPAPLNPVPPADPAKTKAKPSGKKKRKANPLRTMRRAPRAPEVKRLQELMRPLPNLYDFEHLFPTYVSLYAESHSGREPKHARQSFVQAAEACAERLLLERAQF